MHAPTGRIRNSVPTMKKLAPENARRMLGSSFKQEWLAIGKTTNLAARLQSKGEIGEVVTLPEIAERVGFEASGSILKPYDMKGFSEPVPVLRIPVE